MDIACCKICNNFYYQLFIKINIVHAVESVCGADILGLKAAKRASGRSTFLKVSLLTDDLIAVTSHFHKVTDLRMLTRAVKINHSQGLPESSIPEGSGRNHYTSSYDSHSVPLPLIVFSCSLLFQNVLCTVHTR